ncbi:phospholipase A1-II 6-like [Oryza brachyantha]|uniref:Phospholipase A1 n=1 Tax=Oryza brachyantha TaxID=4533 RepID=J3M9Z3_ORYBR|nr:phospholipase A1-II 6-like [Oryza brachyantha]
MSEWLRGTAHRWRELHGQNNWDGLLDPFDLDLRRTVIRYGEMAQATYDAFNHEKLSPHAGLSRFGRRRFFERVQLPDHAAAYRVTKFLYATSSVAVPEPFILRSVSLGRRCRESNWIGYVAVATDDGKTALGRRDIVVAWRGTTQALEWINDMEFVMAPPRSLLGDEASEATVHRGWLSMYTSSDPESSHNKDSARDQVLSEVARLVSMYDGEELSITVTGHSLGAALGTLNAFDIAANGYNRSPRAAAATATGCPVTAFAFASPRVGGHGFRRRFDGARGAGLRLLRVRNARDIVPRYPTALLYHDVGAELAIDTGESPYLRNPGNELLWHNLESYLHGVAGARGGEAGRFELAVERDVALTNKFYGALRDEHPVPAGWWIPSNRGMVRGADGRWTLMDCEEDEDAE